jgi:hypothetical protein
MPRSPERPPAGANEGALWSWVFAAEAVFDQTRRRRAVVRYADPIPAWAIPDAMRTANMLGLWLNNPAAATSDSSHQLLSGLIDATLLTRDGQWRVIKRERVRPTLAVLAHAAKHRWMPPAIRDRLTEAVRALPLQFPLDNTSDPIFRRHATMHGLTAWSDATQRVLTYLLYDQALTADHLDEFVGRMTTAPCLASGAIFAHPHLRVETAHVLITRAADDLQHPAIADFALSTVLRLFDSADARVHRADPSTEAGRAWRALWPVLRDARLSVLGALCAATTHGPHHPETAKCFDQLWSTTDPDDDGALRMLVDIGGRTGLPALGLRLHQRTTAQARALTPATLVGACQSSDAAVREAALFALGRMSGSTRPRSKRS